MEERQVNITIMVVVGALLLTAAAVFVLRVRNADAVFCRGLLADLVKGKAAAVERIDWEHLRALGTDVGREYSRLAKAEEKRLYQTAFVRQFGEGFRQGGGDVRLFTHWRVLHTEGDQVTVAADYQAKHRTLLFSVGNGWTKQLVGLQWQ